MSPKRFLSRLFFSLAVSAGWLYFSATTSYAATVATQVTDGGIAHLKGLAALQLLDLEGTQVTEAAAKRMRDSVPGVMVVRD